MRKFAVALVLASIAVAAPSFADVPAPVAGPHAVALLWTPAHITRVKDAIGVHEGHAKDLQPVVAADTTSRDALKTNAAALEKAAKDNRAQAIDYRTMASTETDKKNKEAFEHFANELDAFAKQNDEGAIWHKEAARKLDDHLANIQKVINWHLARAAELKTALANNS